MPLSSGPKSSAKDSLVFAMDTYDTSNCVTPLGCGGFNNSTQGIKNILNGTTALFQNGLKISNRDFYTAFAIDYPEGSYGGDAANRQGITPGYNVRSGGKIFGYGRALHHSIWDNNSQSWVVHNTYDTYAYSSAVDDFVNNYNNYIKAYPNAVHVVAGSHRDSNHNSNQYTILRDLGAPSNVDSIIGFSSPEWILVGKPGLGAGNAYGWAFQNYSTNPDYVAHMNFSVTPNRPGILNFDGTDDYLNISHTSAIAPSTGYISVEAIFRASSVGSENGSIIYNKENEYEMSAGGGYISYAFRPNWAWVGRTAFNTNQWYHTMLTYDQSYQRLYVNGVETYSASLGGAIGNSYSNDLRIGARGAPGAAYGFFNGDIPVVNIYNRGLTSTEVVNNYKQYKTRFNLS